VDEPIEWAAVVGAVGGIACPGCVGVAVGGADRTIGNVGARSGCGIRGLNERNFSKTIEAHRLIAATGMA
jgi:hypothetical protein